MEQIQIALPNLGKASEIPTPCEYDYWKLREKRIFYIDDSFIDPDDSIALELSKTIINLNFEEMGIAKDELKPIYLFVHTGGGDTFSSNALCDVIKASRIPIITIAMGKTMSAGFDIFIAGHKKYAFPHSQLLVHSGSAEFGGTAEQMADFSKNYKKMLEESKRYVLENTEIPESVFNKNSKRDWYLTSEELIKYKVVDGLITDLSTLFA